MSFRPCSIHGEKINGKLATLYAAWFDDDNTRISYSLKCCAPCLTTLLGSLNVRRLADSSTLAECPICGQDSSTGVWPLYLTIFPPRSEPREYALPTHRSCVTPYFASFAENGTKLPDRFGSNGQDDQDWSAVLA